TDGGTRRAEAVRMVWRLWPAEDRRAPRPARVSPGPGLRGGGVPERNRGRPARGTRAARSDRPGTDDLRHDRRGGHRALGTGTVRDDQRDRAAAALRHRRVRPRHDRSGSLLPRCLARDRGCVTADVTWVVLVLGILR